MKVPTNPSGSPVSKKRRRERDLGCRRHHKSRIGKRTAHRQTQLPSALLVSEGSPWILAGASRQLTVVALASLRAPLAARRTCEHARVSAQKSDDGPPIKPCSAKSDERARSWHGRRLRIGLTRDEIALVQSRIRDVLARPDLARMPGALSESADEQPRAAFLALRSCPARVRETPIGALTV